jgi:Uma2 family endonuclease
MAPGRQLLTAEEFSAFVHRSENEGRSFELVRGEVSELPRPGKLHGFVCANVTTVLGRFAAQRGAGYPCSNGTEMITERGPDTVRAMDVAFYDDNQPTETMDRGDSEEAPLLVAEVLSPEDGISQMNRRTSEYLNRGVRIVWLVDPEVKAVTVYEPDRHLKVLEESGELAGYGALPGFRCAVAELFALPGQAHRIRAARQELKGFNRT